MLNYNLISFVDSILGKGRITSKGNYSYFCPYCKHYKRKLEINFDESSTFYQDFHCWVCGIKGKYISFISKKSYFKFFPLVFFVAPARIFK